MRTTFTHSPFIWLSLITSLWLFLRTVIYRAGPDSASIALVELTIVLLVGVGAAVTALLRDREEAWYIGLVTMVLNVAAWWYAVSQLDWTYLYES